MFKGIQINGTRYYEGSKCLACSSEVDKGGRLELQKRTRIYLKCSKCKYSVLSKKTRNKQENFIKQREKKRVL